jgi:hypothetical protein
MSVSRFLKILSTIKMVLLYLLGFVQTRFPFRITSSLPSSIRGAWLVGPIKVLQISNKTGWCCQYVIKLRNKSGLLNNGLSSGLTAPSVTWFPPPVPVWRPELYLFLNDIKTLLHIKQTCCQLFLAMFFWMHIRFNYTWIRVTIIFSTLCNRF